MPVGGGYLTWSKRFARDRFVLDGYEYATECFASFQQARKPTIAALVGADGTGAVQSHALGGDQPSNLRERIFRADISLGDETDAERLMESLERGPELVSFMAGVWVFDRWRMDMANASQTTWRSSRGLWLPDQSAYAPAFRKVTDPGVRTEWTVIHTGTPTGTEAEYPAASVTDDAFDIETAAQSSEAATFIARYMAVHFVQVVDFTENSDEPNAWDISLQLEEVLVGDYTFES